MLLKRLLVKPLCNGLRPWPRTSGSGNSNSRIRKVNPVSCRAMVWWATWTGATACAAGRFCCWDRHPTTLAAGGSATGHPAGPGDGGPEATLTQGPVLQIDQTPVQLLDEPGRARYRITGLQPRVQQPERTRYRAGCAADRHAQPPVPKTGSTGTRHHSATVHSASGPVARIHRGTDWRS
jgi:hypothetical protein